VTRGDYHQDCDRVPDTFAAGRRAIELFTEVNMNFIGRFFALLVLMGTCFFCHAADSACAAGAIDRAKQLLTFHAGPDERMTIDKTIKQLPSMRNPEDPKQTFEVLEIWGYIYKGKYRMRFIYYNSRASGCLLMGEEILEFARV
jgi:hypothetical protein